LLWIKKRIGNEWFVVTNIGSNHQNMYMQVLVTRTLPYTVDFD